MRPATVLLVLAAAAIAPATVSAARRDWLGSAACGACHPAELAAWRQTPHATTAARLTARGTTACLGCHATGEAPAGPAIAVEVGCESCHGAGAAYAPDDVMRDRPVATALGLVDLATPAARAAACAPCHAAVDLGRAFDPTAPVHAIAGARR